MVTKNKKYTNGEVTVYWVPEKCIHSTICVSNLPSVFNVKERPWVNMEGASTEEIVAVVSRCPSKALDYAYNKDIGE